MCNRRYPQPHRLFLDLSGISKSEAKPDTDDEHKIIIKGMKSQLMSSPSASLVLDLANTMGISLQKGDIKDVVKSGGNLYVTFFSVSNLDLFMENKNKLRGNQQTSRIKINEVLDNKSEELFNYAHKLKQFGYNILFVRHKKIFAKMNQSDAPINIYSKDQVDMMCDDKDSNGCVEKKYVRPTTKMGPKKKSSVPLDRSKQTAFPSKTQSGSSHQSNRGRSNNNTTTKSSSNQNPLNSAQNPSTSLNARSLASNRNESSSSAFLNLSSRGRQTAFTSKTQSESSQQSNRGRSNNTTTKSSSNQNPLNRRSSYSAQNPSTSLNARSEESIGNQSSSSAFQNSSSRDWRNPSSITQRQLNTESPAAITIRRNFSEPTAPDISFMHHMDNDHTVDDTERMFRLLMQEENTNTMPEYGGTNFRQNSHSRQITPPWPLRSTENRTEKNTIFSFFKKITEKFK